MCPDSHCCGKILLAFVIGLLAPRAHAQPPSLLWTTNIGATLFAIDGQTNIYANSGGSVIELSASGASLQTNAICPLSGIAQRDSAGNYYFSGAYTSETDLGGGTVLGNIPFYIAKYTAAGTLLWATGFGFWDRSGYDNGRYTITDMRLDVAGNAYAAYRIYNAQYAELYLRLIKFDSNGIISWDQGLYYYKGQSSYYAGVRLGAMTPTNGFEDLLLDNSGLFWRAYPAEFSADGTVNGLGYSSFGSPMAALYSTPIANSLGEVWNIEGRGLTKRTSCGTLISSNSNSGGWTVGADQFGGVHLSVEGNPTSLARYDYDGNLVWTLSLPALCNAMLLDPQGNRFLSMTSGEVARFAAEPASAPVITNAPQGLTVLAGTNVNFAVGASGSTPMRYFWLSNGNFLLSGTNAILSLTNVTSAQSGDYSVIVSNFSGSVTSAPATLRVKQVELFWGSQLLTNGTYTFPTPPSLSIQSVFASGSSFYTLDGSTPSFSSTYYSGPFTVSNSATVRAIGYSADFSQSEEADIVNAVVLPHHTLTASTSGGGRVSLNPPGGVYASTNIVTATAVPSNGWSFLYWQGDASGNNQSTDITMDRDKTIYAVFRTTLSTTVAGNGQVLLDPSGGLYAYGTVVRLTGLPGQGNYFGFWGNAATGNTNPLYFTVLMPTQTVSAIFGAIPSGQAALTVLINGPGQVTINPRANVYPTNQSVTLTAVPDSGQSFIGWSGDASGGQNPLTIAMTQSKIINANFLPYLKLDRPALDANGFRLTLVSSTQAVFRIQATTNFNAWQNLGVVTNSSGEVQFLDSAATNFNSRFYRAAPWP